MMGNIAQTCVWGRFKTFIVLRETQSKRGLCSRSRLYARCLDSSELADPMMLEVSVTDGDAV